MQSHSYVVTNRINHKQSLNDEFHNIINTITSLFVFIQLAVITQIQQPNKI